MSKKRFKIGFLGGGLNSTIGYIHKLASQLDSRWILEAGFFSRNKEINLKTSKLYGVSLDRTYNNFSDFIKNEKGRIDAVAVLVPTPERYKYIIQLLNNNIPIISEKPIVSEFSHCLNLKKKINNTSFLRVTYNYAGYTLIKELKSLIEKNFFGKIKQIHFEMPQDSFLKKTSKKIRPKKWRLKEYYIPNISHDLGSHLLSLTSYLINEFPSEVMCNYFESSNYKNLIDNGYLWFNFKSGIKGSFWISKSVPGIRNGLRLRIFGEKKSSEWLQTKPEELIIYNDSGSIEKIDNLTFKLESHKKKYNRYKVGHPAGFLEAFANLYYDFADQLDNHHKKKRKNKKQHLFDLKNSFYISKFFNAASKSNKLRKWIKVL